MIHKVKVSHFYMYDMRKDGILLSFGNRKYKVPAHTYYGLSPNLLLEHVLSYRLMWEPVTDEQFQNYLRSAQE